MSAEAIDVSAAKAKRPISVLSAACWGLERLPVVVLIVSIAFLQGYALQFWAGLLGTSGWGVSIGLEVLHLWFWYRAAISAGLARSSWILLALLATGLLLAGALHEITRPLMQESARIDAAGQQRESLQAEAQVLKANLDAFRDMAASQGRRGWQDDIRRDTARLQAIAMRLRSLAAQSNNTARRPWLNMVTQGGVIAVAVLFQIAAVLAVWSLSGSSRKGDSISFRPRVQPSRNTEPTISAVSDISAEPRNSSANVSDISETPGTFRRNPKCPETDFYRDLWEAIEAHGCGGTAKIAQNNPKPTQAALAENLGIKAPDLSAIKLLAAGAQIDRKPARASVEMLAKRFGLRTPK